MMTMIKANRPTILEGKDVTPRIGNTIQVDGWRHGVTLRNAVDVADFFGTGAFRVTTPGTGVNLVVGVEITGRKVNWQSSPKVRVKVTILGDGEPDTEVRGWMWV